MFRVFILYTYNNLISPEAATFSEKKLGPLFNFTFSLNFQCVEITSNNAAASYNTHCLLPAIRSDSRVLRHKNRTFVMGAEVNTI